MYPSPASGAAHGSDHIVLFEFLGRVLGKALYEGITIHPQFAHFFLSFLRGDYNYFHMLADLSTMDSQLYNNIMFLKTYEGDAEDLCLTFTVAVDDFGGNKEIPLMPNGGNIPVTDSNKLRYIGKREISIVVKTIGSYSLSYSFYFVRFRSRCEILCGGPSQGTVRGIYPWFVGSDRPLVAPSFQRTRIAGPYLRSIEWQD
jgi:hypothetical protein